MAHILYPLLLVLLTTPAPDARASAAETQICRSGTKSLGSRIRKPRRCRTSEQWRQEEEQRLPASLQVTPGQNDGQTRPQPR